MSNPGGGPPQYGQRPHQGYQDQWQPQLPPGHDPLGPQEHESVSIDQYALPQSRAKWWLGGVAALIIAALVIAAVWSSRQPTPVIAPISSTPAPSMQDLPSSVPTGNAVAFTSTTDGAEGWWEIQKYDWTDRGLELTIKIQVTKGSFGYSFFCLDNATTNDYDPAEIDDSNALRAGTLGTGESTIGLIVFEKGRGDSMVYLANRFGRQVSALAVTG